MVCLLRNGILPTVASVLCICLAFSKANFESSSHANASADNAHKLPIKHRLQITRIMLFGLIRCARLSAPHGQLSTKQSSVAPRVERPRKVIVKLFTHCIFSLPRLRLMLNCFSSPAATRPPFGCSPPQNTLCPQVGTKDFLCCAGGCPTLGTANYSQCTGPTVFNPRPTTPPPTTPAPTTTPGITRKLKETNARA